MALDAGIAVDDLLAIPKRFLHCQSSRRHSFPQKLLGDLAFDLDGGRTQIRTCRRCSMLRRGHRKANEAWSWSYVPKVGYRLNKGIRPSDLENVVLYHELKEEIDQLEQMKPTRQPLRFVS